MEIPKKKLRLPEPKELEEIEIEQKGMEDIPIEVKLPKKPDNGALIICQFCGNPLYPRKKEFLSKDIPEQLFMSTDESIASTEYMYHFHQNCKLWACEQLDASTPGILAERRPFLEQMEQARIELMKIENNN